MSAVLAAALGGAGASASWAQERGSAAEPGNTAGAAPGDTIRLSIEEAVARATEQSQEVRLARAQVEAAAAQVTSARSAALPQITANLGYTRTFASPFDVGQGVQLPDSLRFSPDPTRPLEERVKYLEDRAPLAGLAGMAGLFSDMPFGRRNTYTAGITGTQLLYSGGRVGAALRIAADYEDAARLNLEEQIAEVELQVRTAYYQALLAKQMEQIARAALEQAEAFLAEERLRRQAGQSSDLDVMRAEVAAENLRPGLVQAQKAAELAELNLKRLLDLPLKQPLVLTTELVPPDPSVVASPPVASAERLLSRRAAVEAARRQVSMREEQVRIAKSAFLPTVALQMNYGRLLYPNRMFDFAGVEPRTDWSATISLQLPIFQGFKRTADIDLAEAELESAKLRLAQLEEQVELQYQQALGDRERAGAEIAARQRTVEQAERVYDLTRMRYERGLATQLEVSEARLALLQARTNLAQALADFYIADAAVIRALGGRAVVERNRN